MLCYSAGLLVISGVSGRHDAYAVTSCWQLQVALNIISSVYVQS